MFLEELPLAEVTFYFLVLLSPTEATAAAPMCVPARLNPPMLSNPPPIGKLSYFLTANGGLLLFGALIPIYGYY